MWGKEGRLVCKAPAASVTGAEASTKNWGTWLCGQGPSKGEIWPGSCPQLWVTLMS